VAETTVLQPLQPTNGRTALATGLSYQPDVIAGAVAVWAKSRTDTDTPRHADLLRDKCNMVMSFFDHAEKHPAEATPLDVQEWIDHLEERGLSSGTVYGYASRLSSWYKWASADERLGAVVNGNPVILARPKAPKAYSNIQALTDEEAQSLLDAVPRDTPTGKRDYAMLLFHLFTGHRRAEVARLAWGDLKHNGTLTVTFRVKGGDYESEEVALICWNALQDYLSAAGRLEGMTPATPLWVGHGYNNKGEEPLSSHALVKNFKRYAMNAGLGDIHLHQLRHTGAAWVADDTGDLTKVQTFLGHKNLATTRVYVKNVTVKKDTHSAGIAKRLGL